MNHLPEQTWRILHIEDDPEDHLILRDMLTTARGRTVEVDWAKSVDEGRQKLNANGYQAVLVDYDLGAANGIDLIREYAGRDYPAPLILLTGRGSYEVDVEAMQVGATLYLTKAEINPLLLERSIRYAIERKQTEAELRKREAELRKNEAELREREAELRESERRYRELAETLTVERGTLATVIEDMPVGVGIADAQGNTLSMNSAGLELHGFESEAEMFSRLERYIAEFELSSLDGRPLPVEEWPASRAVRGEFVHDYMVRLRNKLKGTECILSYSAAPVKNSLGETVLIVYVIQDMDERMRAEAELRRHSEALRESEERYRVALMNLPGVFAQTDEELRYRWIHTPHNDFTAEAAIGKRDDELEDTEETRRLVTLKRRVLEGGAGMREEVTFHRSDGVHIYDMTIEPLRDEQGRIVGVTTAAIDITQRKQVEENLRASEQQYRGLADAMPQLVWTAQPDGKVDYYNRRYQLYAGINLDQSSGWVWAPVLHPDDLQPTISAWQKALNTASTYQIEHRVRMADGSYRWHLSRGIPAYDDQGRLMKWYGTATDIDDFKRAQADLAEYAEKLKNSNEELERFAFVASHDLQEPLRKINMFGSGLRRQLGNQLPPEAEDYLKRMQNATERMQAMINGLLDLSRITTRDTRFEPVNLTRVAEEVASDLEARIQATGGRVIIDQLPTVEGDEMQLRRLLQNLIGNGLKFHKPGVPPRVEVLGGLVRGNGKPLANIVVIDNGVGFDEANASEIFQPFVRLHGRSAYEGSGMGLAICRKIVERHGGLISASSQAGSGSRFTVTLPVKI